MSASLCLIAWNEPICRPNCRRDFAYSTDRSSRCWAAPTCSTANSAEPTCSAWVITRSASCGPASNRAGASVNSTSACGRVRSMVTSGVRVTPDAAASTAYRLIPAEPFAATRISSAAPASTTRRTVPVRCRPGGHRHRRRVERPGLVGNGDGSGFGALDQLGEQLVAGRPSRARHQRGDREKDGAEQRSAGQRRAEHLDGHGLIDQGAADAAVGLGHRQPEHAELGSQPVPHLRVEGHLGLHQASHGLLRRSCPRRTCARRCAAAAAPR